MKDGSVGWWLLLGVLIAAGSVSLHNVFVGALIGLAAVALIAAVLGAYSWLKRLL